MKTRTLTMTALVTALAAGALQLSTTTRTTAGITVSNVLTPAKDGRVLTSTLVPKKTWRGGQTWIITRPIAERATDSLIVRGATMRPMAYTDTVWQAYPTCATYRVTVVPDTVLTSRGALSAKRDSLTVKASLCRPLTMAERAMLDSFPAIRVVPCVATLSDAQWRTHRLDVSGGDSLVFGTVARNRYTGIVQLLDGPPALCEPARARFASVSP